MGCTKVGSSCVCGSPSFTWGSSFDIMSLMPQLCRLQWLPKEAGRKTLHQLWCYKVKKGQASTTARDAKRQTAQLQPTLPPTSNHKATCTSSALPYIRSVQISTCSLIRTETSCSIRGRT